MEYLGNRLIYDTSGPVGPQPTGNPYLSMYIFSQKRGGIRTGPEAKIGSWFCLSYLSLLTSGVGPMGLSIQFYQASSDDTGYPPHPLLLSIFVYGMGKNRFTISLSTRYVTDQMLIWAGESDSIFFKS